MLRFYYLVLVNLGAILYYIPRMSYLARNKARYSEDRRYRVARRILKIIRVTGNIRTRTHGEENLPPDGGYMMYANHQGRYDAIGILSGHKKPCTVVMDHERSQLPIASQFVDMLEGKRLDRSDLRQQVGVIREISEEVQQGRRFLLFPEGGYDCNENTLQPFHAGSFKCAMRAKCPIVPVVIVDSYKVFTKNTLRKVTTDVYFLEPLHYEQYCEMNSREICEEVYSRIEKQLERCRAESSPKAMTA